MLSRRTYARVTPAMDPPNLLEIQKKSYDEFLQPDIPPRKRENQGLEAAFQSTFPIDDMKGYYSLEYEGYRLGTPKYGIEECKERGLTYAVPLKLDLSLLVYEPEGETKRFVEKITNEVYLGELPLMTQRGTFVINGAERVIVNQLHRSPGITFDEVTYPNGKKMLTARIIPQRGSWIEIIYEDSNNLVINIDRRKKMPLTILLRALGYSTDEEIIGLFQLAKSVAVKKSAKDEVVGNVCARPVFLEQTGEIIVDANEVFTEDHFNELVTNKVSSVEVIERQEDTGGRDIGSVIRNTIANDHTKSEQEALFYIYNTVRPGDPPNVEAARNLIFRMFFDETRYDLGKVGRYRVSRRLKTPFDDKHVLTKEDIIAACTYLVGLKNGEGFVDDIDHLGNRRVRSVGELLATQFTVGLTRMIRTVRERLGLHAAENISPQDLINARAVSTVIQAFFGTSQLSQFLDQTNPISELTHKRRVSALGPGGLSRERAGFEVRDVHHTHYGRLCPIETPEGPNIGLIASLSTYARINELGFIETPYLKVENGKVTKKIEYLSADMEDNYRIAQAQTAIDKNGAIKEDHVFVRYKGDFPVVSPQQVDYMDVSPMQAVSVSAGLIPFLEHDDANRALMGSNMQRQSVPLLFPEQPCVGTGVEGIAASDTGCLVLAESDGIVHKVDARRIVVKKENVDDTELALTEYDTYDLTKFQRSNQDTTINQRACVHQGDTVKKGDVLADGYGTQHGKLALGRNALVAFMPWRGYNFEDAIVLSQRLVEDDVYTSVHIEKFELEVRETKRGPEELTREIPNVSETALGNLDESGVVRIGTEVSAGDILVGKITPKGKKELSPEERLLRAIFGEKAGDVMDSSLKAPPGLKGVVIDTRVYSRKDAPKRSQKKDKARIDEVRGEINEKIEEIVRVRNERLKSILDGTKTEEIRSAQSGDVVAQAGLKWRTQLIKKIDFTAIQYDDGVCDDPEKSAKAEKIIYKSNDVISKLEDTLDKEIDKIIRGDELKPGVLKLVKVYVAKKLKVSVGDKMAGRHGNKGVVSKIVPKEDMPFMPDGTPVDVILNPLGVPSRMNVGQILETHMGWACKELGINATTPVFNGANADDVENLLKEAGLPPEGKTTLRDGLSGEPFDHPITVGYMYVMKLCHLVDDKLHARSIGPYSLVTQQPLGGKSQFGGQRLGEMEVWALEAYGAAYTLKQMLTVKSDDLQGRSKIYEAIVKGENAPTGGIPESFKVLMREIKALAVDIELVEEED